MLEEIKKIQGINHDEFDTMINTWIEASKQDLINIGIKQTLVSEATDSLIKTTIIQFVLSQLDISNSELYANSYSLLKDTLRRVIAYQEA
jgi:hypothetical protein